MRHVHRKENPLLVTYEILFLKLFCQRKSHTFSQIKTKVNTVILLYSEPKPEKTRCENWIWGSQEETKMTSQKWLCSCFSNTLNWSGYEQLSPDAFGLIYARNKVMCQVWDVLGIGWLWPHPGPWHSRSTLDRDSRRPLDVEFHGWRT